MCCPAVGEVPVQHLRGGEENVRGPGSNGLPGKRDLVALRGNRARCGLALESLDLASAVFLQPDHAIATLGTTQERAGPAAAALSPFLREPGSRMRRRPVESSDHEFA